MNSFNHEMEHIDSRMIKIEVNLDDMPGEWMGHLINKLLSLGANDVYYTPIYMKKNRPGILLSVLVAEDKSDQIKDTIFQETTTFGLRYSTWNVHRLGRKFIKVNTQWGLVTVKAAVRNGQLSQISPEYEECKRIAEKENIPLKHVYHEVYCQIGKESLE